MKLIWVGKTGYNKHFGHKTHGEEFLAKSQYLYELAIELGLADEVPVKTKTSKKDKED